MKDLSHMEQRPRGQGRVLCLTCHTPTTALAIRIMIMTMGSTNAVVVSSPSSNQARIWWQEKRWSTVWFKQEQQRFEKSDGNKSQTTGGYLLERKQPGGGRTLMACLKSEIAKSHCWSLHSSAGISTEQVGLEQTAMQCVSE